MSRSCLATVILLAMTLTSVRLASAEDFQLMKIGHVYLDDVVPAPRGEHSVVLYLRAETLIGEPIQQLGPSSLSIRDNGEIVGQSDVELKLLSTAGIGTSAVLVLDTSRSMSGEPFDRARASALAFLDRMGEFDHVAIVTFDDYVQVLSPFGAPKTAARLSLEDLEVKPKTLSKLVWDGVNKGIELLRARPAEFPKRGFVIAFSDGRDSNSTHELSEVIGLANGGPGEGRVPVFTIGYSRFGGTGLGFLDELARGTSASFFEAKSANEMSRFFDEIWKRMTRSLVVTYPAEMDGARHTINVTIGERSDTREVDYPEISRPVWPWLLGLTLLAAAAAAILFFVRSRTVGRLIFEGGNRSGQAVEIKGPKMRLGALEDNEVVLNYPTISRYHAQIFVRSGNLEIEDMGSKNGTYINGTLIRTRSEIRSGDRLRFGDVEMIYRA